MKIGHELPLRFEGRILDMIRKCASACGDLLARFSQVSGLHLVLTSQYGDALEQRIGKTTMCAIATDQLWKTRLKTLGIVVVLFTSIVCHSADVSAEQSLLVALENAWNQAQLHKDTTALSMLTAEGFVYTDTDGTVMNKAEFLADAKNPAYHAALATNENVVVRLYETTAIVIGRYHTKGTFRSKPFDHHGRFTDTWVQRGNKWQCVASHTSLLAK
jgi:Domain of unknown function (DUF4440)